jgi:hypothetical protein
MSPLYVAVITGEPAAYGEGQSARQRQYRLEPDGGGNYVTKVELCYEETELKNAGVTSAEASVVQG